MLVVLYYRVGASGCLTMTLQVGAGPVGMELLDRTSMELLDQGVKNWIYLESVILPATILNMACNLTIIHVHHARKPDPVLSTLTFNFASDARTIRFSVFVLCNVLTSSVGVTPHVIARVKQLSLNSMLISC